METTKFEPDVSRISESLRVLSDELPRLSNLESTAILRVLQDLREDIHNDNTLLNNKVNRMQETLASLESHVMKLEQVRPKDEVKAEDDTSASQFTTTNLLHDVKPKSGFPDRDQVITSRLQGASGAILILATFVPILLAVLYF